MENRLCPDEECRGVRTGEVGNRGISGYINYRTASQCLKFLSPPAPPSSELPKSGCPPTIAHHRTPIVVDRTAHPLVQVSGSSYGRLLARVFLLKNESRTMVAAPRQLTTTLTGKQLGPALPVQNTYDRIAILTPQHVDDGRAEQAAATLVVEASVH